MIAFHCFAELPQLDPESGNGWTDRAQYETDAVLALAVRGKLPFDSNCRYVLKELAGLVFDEASGCAIEPGSTAQRELCSLDPDTREALAIVLMRNDHGAWQAFAVNNALKKPRILRVLQALPIVIQVAATFQDYREIAHNIEMFCSDGMKLVLRPSEIGGEVFCPETIPAQAALSDFRFTVEANGRVYHVCQAAPKMQGNVLCTTGLGVRMITFEWANKPEIVRKKLLEKRDALPTPLEPVREKPISAVGEIDGMPVLGCLLFAPDRCGRGLLTIVHSGTGLTTAEDSAEPRGDLKTLCADAYARAKEENGTVVSLVTAASPQTVRDYTVLDGALYCITATPAGITVSDYRAALKEFADAIRKYLL